MMVVTTVIMNFFSFFRYSYRNKHNKEKNMEGNPIIESMRNGAIKSPLFGKMALDTLIKNPKNYSYAH